MHQSASSKLPVIMGWRGRQVVDKIIDSMQSRLMVNWFFFSWLTGPGK